MQKFTKRLKYYGIGFGFGLIFVIFFFQNRGCSWLPSNRVKNSILDRVLVISDETSDQMKESSITNEELVQVLNDGDILFNESDKSDENKNYIIEKGGIKYVFTLPSESFISEVFVDASDEVYKTSTTGVGHLIHFPLDSNLVYVDTNKMVGCQQEALNLISPKDILKLIKESGTINFDKSDLSVRPKAEHILEFMKGDLKIEAKVIWYKNKLNVTSFTYEGSEECED